MLHYVKQALHLVCEPLNQENGEGVLCSSNNAYTVLETDKFNLDFM